MKKVVKLTESDLIKIVKKVLNEESNDKLLPKKLKVVSKNNETLDNWDIFLIEFNGENLEINYNQAGSSKPKSAQFSCRDKKLHMTGMLVAPGQEVKFSYEGTNWIVNNYCNQYSQTNKNIDTSSYT